MKYSCIFRYYLLNHIPYSLELILYEKRYRFVKLSFTSPAKLKKLIEDLSTFSYSQWIYKNPLFDIDWASLEQINPCIFKEKYWWTYLIEYLGREKLLNILNDMLNVMFIERFKTNLNISDEVKIMDINLNNMIVFGLKKDLPPHVLTITVDRFTQNKIDIYVNHIHSNIKSIRNLKNGTLDSFKMIVREEIEYDSYFFIEKSKTCFFGVGNDERDLLLDKAPLIFSIKTNLFFEILDYFYAQQSEPLDNTRNRLGGAGIG